MTDFATHIRAFLCEHLPRDRGASRHTIDSYVTSFQLLVCYTSKRLGIRPCRIRIEHLGPQLILDFLDFLERERGNAVSTRNVRLAAVKSFFRYLEQRVPACLEQAGQVHAIPAKRGEEPLVDYLSRDEIEALLNAPDARTALGVRDRAMVHLAYAAGLRVSELIGLRTGDLRQPDLGTVRLTGKGRRERELPLWKQTRSVLRDWLAIRPERADRLFPNARGQAMSRHGFAQRLRVHAATARQKLPSLASKRISPHVLRHSCAMHTLEATGDIRKVSLWLGHQSIRSTEIYLRADQGAKLEMLAKRSAPMIEKGSFRDAPDRLLAILKGAKGKQ